MSSFYELDETIKFLNDYGNELSIMQCTTSYPQSHRTMGIECNQRVGV